MKHTIHIAALLLCCSSALIHASEQNSEKFLLDSLPDTWQYEQQYFQITPSEDAWWNSFNDPELLRLIKLAVENNYNVLAAQQRIIAAKQLQREAASAWYPTLQANAGWQRERNAGAIAGHRGVSTQMDYFSLGLSMNWEIDLFGKVASQVKSDKEQYNATVADYDATLVSLCSSLAKAYVQLRVAQAQIRVAEANISEQEELLRLATTRYEVGLVPSVDVVEARMVVSQTRSDLPELECTVATAINEIALLVGEYPNKIKSLLAPAPLPDAPVTMLSVSPDQLLRRRPDIVAAERTLAAQAALVGVAKKDFLPTLSVSASVATEAHDITDLFGKGSLSYSIMPTLSWTVFDGFARNARLASARASLNEQIDSYNLTVMTAVQEVNNAVATYKSVSYRLALNTSLVKDSRRELELQTDRYRQGLSDFTDVAQAQISVLEYANTEVQLQGAKLSALITLYTALGGGFGDVVK